MHGLFKGMSAFSGSFYLIQTSRIPTELDFVKTPFPRIGTLGWGIICVCGGEGLGYLAPSEGAVQPSSPFQCSTAVHGCRTSLF